MYFNVCKILNNINRNINVNRNHKLNLKWKGITNYDIILLYYSHDTSCLSENRAIRNVFISFKFVDFLKGLYQARIISFLVGIASHTFGILAVIWWGSQAMRQREILHFWNRIHRYSLDSPIIFVLWNIYKKWRC